MQEVTTLPRGVKAKQVAFTIDRMFVVSEKGELYLFKIKIDTGERQAAQVFLSEKIQIQAEVLMADGPKKIPID